MKQRDGVYQIYVSKKTTSQHSYLQRPPKCYPGRENGRAWMGQRTRFSEEESGPEQGPPASESRVIFIEMQVPGPQLRLVQSEPLKGGPGNLRLNNLSKWFMCIEV